MKTRIGFVGLGLLLTACAGDLNEQEDEAAPAAVVEAIIGGQPASPTYPEAALLMMKTTTGSGYGCSATVIAPKVVLTAGHCVDGFVSWTITNGATTKTSTSAETYDWAENGATSVDPTHHDIGLIYLSEPIALASYPVLAQTKQANGTAALSVGRVLDGTVTNSLYDAPITLTDATSIGYPYDYSSGVVIQHGDSGGPVFVQGTHNLVAVNSGAGTSTQVTARVDVLYTWIQSKIAAHSTVTPAPAPAPASTCTQEKESNDTFGTANSAASAECGSLSGSDVDWFTYTAGYGTSTLTLTPTGDATMSAGYLAAGKCRIAVSNARSLRVTTSGAMTICASISSPTHATQTYRLTH
jgi:hypothetical protein